MNTLYERSHACLCLLLLPAFSVAKVEYNDDPSFPGKRLFGERAEEIPPPPVKGICQNFLRAEEKYKTRNSREKFYGEQRRFFWTLRTRNVQRKKNKILFRKPSLAWSSLFATTWEIN